MISLLLLCTDIFRGKMLTTAFLLLSWLLPRNSVSKNRLILKMGALKVTILNSAYFQILKKY